MDERLAELMENFSECDANGDDKIQFNEFSSLLQNLGSDMSNKECKIGFESVDTDSDGVISFDEFVAWWTDQ